MLKYIGISGYSGSGKSTLANIIVRVLNSHGYPATIKSFADPLKTIVANLTGVNTEMLEDEDFKNSELEGTNWIVDHYLTRSGDILPLALIGQWERHYYYKVDPIRKALTPRMLLQIIGTELRNQVTTNIWVNALFTEHEKRSKNNPNPYICIIPDVRFVNELAAIKERGGIVIRIERPDLVLTAKHNHISETSLATSFSSDNTIYNNNTIADLELTITEYFYNKGILIKSTPSEKTLEINSSDVKETTTKTQYAYDTTKSL